MKDKRAVSPVISTVLLVLIVIVLAIIVLMWSRGFIKEALTKDIAGQVKRVEQYCGEMKLKPYINDIDNSMGFQNMGNVPVYGFVIKSTRNDGTGESRTEKITRSVNPGLSVDLPSNYGAYTDYGSVKIIPIVLGKSKAGGVKEFQCLEENALEIV